MSISKIQLRKFGVVVGGIFLAIALAPLFYKNPTKFWLAVLGSGLVALGGVYPNALYWPYRGWMAVAHVLGYINQRLILGIMFYFVVTPLALIRKLRGVDPLHLYWDANTSSYTVTKSKRPNDHLRRQF